MTVEPGGREFGMGRGKVFPASRARSLVNPLRRLVQSPARTVAAMGLAPDARVLEVGSGPGFFTPYIAGAVPNGALVVLDLQAEMLTLARGRLAGHGGAAAGLVRADAMYLPLATGSFDAVLIATVLGEVPDPARCLAEVRRVLRPGGWACFAETRRDSDFIPLGRLTGAVEAHSFQFVGRRGGRWQYLARFRAV